MWQQTVSDLRLSLRLLRKNPGFTAVAITALALGMGGNTAIFTVVDIVLLRPLPYRDSGRLVAILGATRQLKQMPLSAPDYLDYRGQSRSFSEMFAYNPFSYNITAVANAERVTGVQVSANGFDVLGARPLLGRTFAAGEDQPNAPPVVVLSHALWQRQFAGDAATVGKTIALNGKTSLIVGVMPADFTFPYGQTADVWLPLVLQPGDLAKRGTRSLWLVGRLGPGVSAERAQAEMQGIASRLAGEYPRTNNGLGIRLLSLHEQVVGRSRTALLILLGAVGFVLLIACANVANLLLARAAVRQREVAVRRALGASSGSLIRQLLTESVVLSVLAGTLGTGLAVWAVSALRASLPTNIPRIAELSIDLRVLAATLAASVLTGLLFGVAPALQLSRSDQAAGLQGAGRTFGGKSSGLPARFFITAEVALALVLAIGAGLLIQSFARLERAAIGFNPAGLISFNVWPSDKLYSQAARKQAYYDQVVGRVAAIPGVLNAAAIACPPLGGGCPNGPASIDGRTGDAAQIHSNFNIASRGSFETAGIPIRAGRDFTERDGPTDPPVAVINEAFARAAFGDENPLGQRIRFFDQVREIVGVVGNVRQIAAQEPPPTAYAPASQFAWPFMTVLVRSRGGEVPVGAIRSAVREVDPDQPMYKVQSLNEARADGLAQPRFETILLAAFAGMALLLASIGIYGLMAYWVEQRTPEIGIRMALGAQRQTVLRMVLRQGLLLVLCGVAAGIAGALALNRVLETLLFGVTPRDLATFTASPLLLLFVAVLAIWIPARRATRIDPLAALRWE